MAKKQQDLTLDKLEPIWINQKMIKINKTQEKPENWSDFRSVVVSYKGKYPINLSINSQWK